jgi:hypothetical protein
MIKTTLPSFLGLVIIGEGEVGAANDENVTQICNTCVHAVS